MRIALTARLTLRGVARTFTTTVSVARSGTTTLGDASGGCAAALDP
jgi:hypothetical protein